MNKKKILLGISLGIAIITGGLFFNVKGDKAQEAELFDVVWELQEESPTERVYNLTIQNPEDLATNQDVKLVVDNASVDLSSSNIELKRIVANSYFVKIPIMEEQATTTIIEDYKSAVEENGYLIVETNSKDEMEQYKYFPLDKISSQSSLSADYTINHNIDVKIGEEDEERFKNIWTEFNRNDFTNTNEKIETDYSSLTLPAEGETFTWQVTIKNLGLKDDEYGNSGKVAIWIGGVEYHPWWTSAWTARRKVTFNNATSSSDLINFPVLVSLNAITTDLHTANIDYSLTQDAGEDIRFVDYDGNALDYEIESWNESATSTVWVETPSIEGSTSTQYFWMYYGNSGASDNSSSTAVWNSDYVGVWHMATATDSTVNHNDGVPKNDITAISDAKINGAYDFDGSDDYIEIADSLGGELDFGTDNFSYSFWLKTSTQSDQQLLYKRGSESGNPGYNISIRVEDGTLESVIDDGSSEVNFDGNTDVTDDIWHYVTVVYNRNGNMDLYLDGILDGSASITSVNNSISNASNLGFAQNMLSNTQRFNGIIDETRIMNTATSSDWIAASYESVVSLTSASTTDDFISFGAEETTVNTETKSVGTGGQEIFSTGTATNVPSTTIVTFSTALPDNVGIGDALVFTPSATTTIYYIEARDSANQVRLHTEPVEQHDTEAFKIGRVYSTLSGWEAGEQADLTAGGGTVKQASCYGDGADTTAFTVTGWTTSASTFIRIFAPTSTDEVGTTQAHSGIWDASKFNMAVTNSNMINIDESFVRIEYLQFNHITNDATNYYEAILVDNTALGDSAINISKSIFWASYSGSGGGHAFIRTSDSDAIVNYFNNIAYGNTQAGETHWALDNASAVLNIYNSTFFNNDIAIYQRSGTVTVVNSAVVNNSDDFLNSPDSITYTASDDGDCDDATCIDASPGSPEGVEHDKMFVSTTTPDFHIKDPDSVLYNAGTADPGSGLFNDDIDGETRTNWDIGADEYISGEPPPVTGNPEGDIQIKGAKIIIKGAKVIIK